MQNSAGGGRFRNFRCNAPLSTTQVKQREFLVGIYGWLGGGSILRAIISSSVCTLMRQVPTGTSAASQAVRLFMPQ